MRLEEALARNKEIALLSIKGQSDEEISREMNLNVLQIAKIRTSLGIYRGGQHCDILQDHKTVGCSNYEGVMTWRYPSFRLPDEVVETNKLDNTQPIEFTGKMEGKKLVLSFRQK